MDAVGTPELPAALPLPQGKVGLDFRKNFFTKKVVQPWHRGFNRSQRDLTAVWMWHLDQWWYWQY